jgi:hypothetical protein
VEGLLLLGSDQQVQRLISGTRDHRLHALFVLLVTTGLTPGFGLQVNASGFSPVLPSRAPVNSRSLAGYHYTR